MDNNTNSAGHAPAVQDGPVVIEATWAPKDPRDKLYDDDATARERTMSFIRILAAFHPVLNTFLLTGDMLARLPKVVLGIIFVITIICALWYFIG
ncbi:hypothetical protein [Kordiimonas sp.]|uniref:hypothetical protein n=1 Tax=Kordiimonas sp. TaxID=1970157 RepID=UPI003A8D3085